METNRVFLFVAGLLIIELGGWGWTQMNRVPAPALLPAGVIPPGGQRIAKSDWAWRRQLTGEQYDVARKGGTEWAFSSSLNSNHRAGIYRCVCCRNLLFRSNTKFESGTGWPSFFAPVTPNAVYNRPDGARPNRGDEPAGRTEVRCTVCDAHLGHVFRDGPPPTGLRYCLNGVALVFD